MNIEKALTIPGWSSEEELTYLAELATQHKNIVEIGSWRGRSARAFADNLMEGGILTCVDTWADNAYGNPGWWSELDGPSFCTKADWLWNAFQVNLKDYIPSRIKQVRLNSVDAAIFLSGNKYDVIFIDAGHDLQSVRNDILAWLPLLADGGVFCGHDYHPHTNPEVMQAVKELVGDVILHDTIWTAK